MFRKISEMHDRVVMIENQNNDGIRFIFILIGAAADRES